LSQGKNGKMIYLTWPISHQQHSVFLSSVFLSATLKDQNKYEAVSRNDSAFNAFSCRRRAQVDAHTW
jgi:hypothetical protein